MEKAYDPAGAWIDSSEVRPLAGVTMVATPGPVPCSVRSTMLPSNDVFGVKREVRFIILVNAAILTSVAGPLPDNPTEFD
jgi:hypothetical protein